ncbi:MAG: hypothetical protein BJ554DRAFT_6671 [Olpidium bornovanus]|uniref:Uncharacterized protein n=1 Tax=Olpidium bornovanus TaxID=278681 RepID=A0A8H7ZXU4_9FUNG|nr:MAG: hypothetical protein BJ554DRAFT_6671 [Olpidium bornovanus]
MFLDIEPALFPTSAHFRDTQVEVGKNFPRCKRTWYQSVLILSGEVSTGQPGELAGALLDFCVERRNLRKEEASDEELNSVLRRAPFFPREQIYPQTNQICEFRRVDSRASGPGSRHTDLGAAADRLFKRCESADMPGDGAGDADAEGGVREVPEAENLGAFPAPSAVGMLMASGRDMSSGVALSGVQLRVCGGPLLCRGYDRSRGPSSGLSPSPRRRWNEGQKKEERPRALRPRSDRASGTSAAARSLALSSSRPRDLSPSFALPLSRSLFLAAPGACACVTPVATRARGGRRAGGAEMAARGEPGGRGDGASAGEDGVSQRGKGRGQRSAAVDASLQAGGAADPKPNQKQQPPPPKNPLLARQREKGKPATGPVEPHGQHYVAVLPKNNGQPKAPRGLVSALLELSDVRR